MTFMRALGRLVAAALPYTVAGVPAWAAAQPPEPPRARVVAALDAVARAPVERGELAGLTVVVRRGPDVLLARGYGRADVDRGTPMTVDHVFPIASLTKQITAAAVLRLVESGRVRLDDAITSHVPDGSVRALVRGRHVTVRQLLTHTAGIPDFADRPDPDSARRRDARPEDALARVRDLPPDFEPGAELRYSNTGYVMLGMLLERHARRSFAEHVTRALFDPLGMRTAGYCGGRTGAAAPVPGYRHTRTGLRRVEPLHPSVAHAAGGTHVCASAVDLAAWNDALHRGGVLRPTSYAAMTTGAVVGAPGDAPPRDSLRTRYGFGVALSTLAGRRAVHHGGDVGGYATYLAYLPDAALSVVVLMNTEGPVRHAALAEQLVVAALGPAPAPSEPAGRPSPASLAALVGRYGDGRGDAPAAFTTAGDGLAFVWGGGPPEPLRWAGGRTFDAGTSRFAFHPRPGAQPSVWADLTYAVARWTRVAPAR